MRITILAYTKVLCYLLLLTLVFYRIQHYEKWLQILCWVKEKKLHENHIIKNFKRLLILCVVGRLLVSIELGFVAAK